MHFQFVLLVSLVSIGCALSTAIPLEGQSKLEGERKRLVPGDGAQIGLSQLEPVESDGSNLESSGGHRRDARFIFPIIGYPTYHHHYYRSYPVWGYHGYHHYW